MVFLVTSARNQHHRMQSGRRLRSTRATVIYSWAMKTMCFRFCATPCSAHGRGVAAGLPSRDSGNSGFFSCFVKGTLCFLLLVGSALASSHPGIAGQNADCALCHADMTKGQSVHSQGELACNLCHVPRQGSDAVEFTLTLPKEEICHGCHEHSAMQAHVSSSQKKDCLDCHDAHRSARPMLLRRNIDANYAQQTARPTEPLPAMRKPSASRIHSIARPHTKRNPQSTDQKM